MQTISKPSWFLYLTEIVRAFIDIVRGVFFKFNYQSKLTTNSHPVLVVPGFLGSDFSTSFLRKFLVDLGYPVYGWGLGRNLGDLGELVLLSEKIKTIHAKHNQKVTLIGWSLGGVYVRELAKQNPDIVCQIITMGSPFKNIDAPNHARWIFDLIGKKDKIDPKVIVDVPSPAPVPTIAIYTKQDGVVPWQACMEVEDENHHNIEVWGSHCGLIFNPEVYQILVEQLRLSTKLVA